MFDWVEDPEGLSVWQAQMRDGKYVIAGSFDGSRCWFRAAFYSSVAGEKAKEEIGSRYEKSSDAEKACADHHGAKTQTLDIPNNPDNKAIVGMEVIKGDIIIATTSGVYWLDGFNVRTGKLKRIEFEGE